MLRDVGLVRTLRSGPVEKSVDLIALARIEISKRYREVDHRSQAMGGVDGLGFCADDVLRVGDGRKQEAGR